MPPAAAPPPAARAGTRRPLIDPGRCTGCGWCVPTCEPVLLSLDTVHGKKSALLHDAHRCTGCSLCARKCPFGAISMHRPEPGR